jgi:PAS domain S-box-containing protein
MGADEFSKDTSLDNKLIEALLDENRDALLLASDNLEIIKVNQPAIMLLGASAENLTAMGFAKILDQAGMARLKSTIAILGIDGESVKIPMRFQDYLGERRECVVKLRLIRYPTRERSYILLKILSPPKAGTEVDRLDPTQFIKKLIGGLSDSVIFIDISSKSIADCNAAAESLFGYRRDELVGRSPHFLMASEELARTHVVRSKGSYAKTGFYQDKMLCRRKDGTQFMTLATNIAFFTSSGEHKYTVAINRDISEMTKRIDDILRLSEQSKQLLQILSDAIMPLKHDVPVQSLSGMGFSKRQIEIASVLAKGETTKAIASELKVSESTVKSYLSGMYRRVGVSSRMEFVRFIHERQIRLE